MKPDGCGRKVAVALSGGVDSAAAACILKDRGFEVLALTMRTPTLDESESGAVAVARAVAKAIGIEHEILYIEKQFERLVIEPFLETYINGETPNPCVVCNRDVKFGLMLDEASKRGCALMATGHYARIDGGGKTPYEVFCAADRDKDQTYVLWTLDQTTLSRVLFPLGRLTKAEAAAIARDAGVRDTTPESQDICFLAGDSYSSLVAARAPDAIRPGPIVDVEGDVVGTHRGVAFYTVGQRRGLGVGGPSAMYVLEINPAENTLVVGDRRSLSTEEFRVAALNFISAAPPADRFECFVKTRYKGPSLPALVEEMEDDLLSVRYREPGPPAAPGQSAVFYLDDELLGGGVIVRKSSEVIQSSIGYDVTKRI